jgi:hypothetical protein
MMPKPKNRDVDGWAELPANSRLFSIEVQNGTTKIVLDQGTEALFANGVSYIRDKSELNDAQRQG